MLRRTSAWNLHSYTLRTRTHPPLPCRSFSGPSPPSPDESPATQQPQTIGPKPGPSSETETREQHIDKLKQKLRELTETTSKVIRERTDGYTARAASTFAQLGSELNKVTGYGEIELLKKRVVEQEARIKAARHAAKLAKEDYDRAVLQRANSQREVNDLLQRKSSWSDEDVSRFTSLVRQDHLHEQDEARAKAHAAVTESEVEREFTGLMRQILHRYHEEQVWSDKIRSASTYGSLTVLGLNLFVFIMATLLVEPWKRRRLAQTFEKKVEEMTTETMGAFDERTKQLVVRLEKQDEALLLMADTLHHITSPSATATPSGEILLSDDNQPLVPPIRDEASNEARDAPSFGWLPPSMEDPRWLALCGAATAGLLGWVARGWFGR